MRDLVYSVAASLDGYIAGPNGEFDWITNDPTIDFGEIFRQFDTAIMGRICYQDMLRLGRSPKEFGMKIYIASTTLNPIENPGVTIVSEDLPNTVSELKRKSGKSIWLFGGGRTFRSLLDSGLVDRVEVSLVLFFLVAEFLSSPPGRRWPLIFKNSRTFPSGIVSLTNCLATQPQI